MRDLDKRTIEKGNIPGKDLMYRAGIGAGEYILDFIKQYSSQHKKRFIILAGKGNNGGDAFVIAKYLAEKTDMQIIIFATSAIEELSLDAKFYAEQLPTTTTYEVREKLKYEDFQTGDIIIDGILGSGFKGKLREYLNNWFTIIKSSHLPIISLDIPSGLNADDGSHGANAIFADLTISMGMPKLGYFNSKNSKLFGRLKNVDIGIPKKFINEIDSEINAIFECDVRKIFKKISNNSEKYSRGYVSIIGGSSLYRGAPFLSAKAALRSGAGIVTLMLPKSIVNSSDYKALIMHKLTDKNGFFSKESIKDLKPLIKTRISSIVIGPGMGNKEQTIPFLAEVAKQDIPIVFDADALNLICKKTEIITERKGISILTPHGSEMRRLCEAFEIESNGRINNAKKLAKLTNSTVVLKGNRTIIVSPNCELRINTSGSPALATAGSGDVLAGMIASYLAQGYSSEDASTISVFIHGLIGEKSPYGIRGLIADDIIDLIPEVTKQITPFA